MPPSDHPSSNGHLGNLGNLNPRQIAQMPQMTLSAVGYLTVI